MKERRQGKKNPGQSSSYQHQNKKFKDPQGSSQPTVKGPAQTNISKTTFPTPSIVSAPKRLVQRTRSSLLYTLWEEK